LVVVTYVYKSKHSLIRIEAYSEQKFFRHLSGFDEVEEALGDVGHLEDVLRIAARGKNVSGMEKMRLVSSADANVLVSSLAEEQ
jgi:hypothetical protein